jgi:hypothetical protein
MYVATLTAKAAATPTAATIAPPIAGPTLRAMLNPMLFSATAPGNSERGTMSPTDACHAGALNALPHPIRNVNSSRSHGVISPSHAKTASTIETSRLNTCVASMTLRRSRLSAIAPAINENSMIGSVTDTWTSATIAGAGAIESISQDAPTDWISPPKLATVLASQTLRNTG